MRKFQFLFAALFALAFACTSELEKVTSEQSTSFDAARRSSKPLPDSVCIDTTLIRLYANIKCSDLDRLGQPVVGCNGITYPNSCEAKKAGVRFFQPVPPPVDSLPVPPPCIDTTLIKISKKLVCPAIKQPVIGCDKVVYANPCEAQKAGVRFFKPVEPKPSK